jgi:ABC-2 type transport system ATP-binding protein
MPVSPAPLLSISNLRVDFPDVVAVEGLSLDLSPGDVCGLIGPNGAGKTTTMRVVVGLLKPTRGQVRVMGFDPAREPQLCKRTLGFMPDAAPLYPKLKVHEFLDHFARAHGVDNRARRIAECLELAWLSGKASALCGELSRGMKQRLMLAKTLLHDPWLLVLDEPASGIDPLGRIELRKLLLQLRDAGKAILISSHILTEMDQFCNRVAIMERGRLVRSGPIEDLAREAGRRHIAVKWRHETTLAEQVLRGSAFITGLEVEGRGARFDFAGDDEALDALLAELVRSEVRITQWRCLDENIEQILLQSGAREVM